MHLITVMYLKFIGSSVGSGIMFWVVTCNSQVLFGNYCALRRQLLVEMCGHFTESY